MKTFILAIDFDGTIATDSFPEVGTLIKDADRIIQKLYEEGHDIIINTCRTGKYEGLAEYFAYNGFAKDFDLRTTLKVISHIQELASTESATSSDLIRLEILKDKILGHE